MLADLYAVPSPSDVAVLCTNLRTMNGKRPVFIDDMASVFLFPLIHLRFIEIPPGTVEQTADERPRIASTAVAPVGGQPEDELEIDEEFLRRVRDV
jgi:hypothetical protein